MKSKRARRFRELLDALSQDVRRQAYAAYGSSNATPSPRLTVQTCRPADTRVFSAHRDQLQSVGLREDDNLIVWFWIGSHADYDKLVSQ